MRVDAGQAPAAGLALPHVAAADRGDEQLDGLADLHAERLGDLLLAAEAVVQELHQPLVVPYAEEPPPRQQRHERPHHVPLGRLRPGDRVEGGGGGDAALRRPDQRPPPAVGGQAQLDAVGAAQVGEPVGRRGRPPGALHAGGRLLPGRADRPEHAHRVGLDVLARLDQDERRSQLGVVLGDGVGELVEAVGVQRVAPAEQLAQHVLDPGLLAHDGVGLPGGVLLTQPVAGLLVQRVEGGPGAAQHRQAQERPVRLDQAQPVAVLFNAVGGGAAERAAHRVASRFGTTKTTATGKLCGFGSR